MRGARRLAVLLPFASALAAAGAPPVLPPGIADEPFELRAGRIEYTNQTFFASGGVTGRFENAVVTADQVSGNHETGDLRIEGGIRFERGDILWQGGALDYNYLAQTGSFGPSSLDFDPVLLSADRIERVSTNEYRLRGATFTTCPLEKTHYHIRAREARLIDEKVLVAKGATFYLGSVPVFYWPYWRQELSQGIFSYNAGYGSEWGAYGLVRATVPLSPHVDSITDVNLYAKRGVGVGQGFSWERPQAVGRFAAFYLRDEDPYSRYDTPAARQQIGDDRYRFKLEHLRHFSDTHYLNTKWNYLSDPAVLEEFFKPEYRLASQPENYASWVFGNSAVGSEAYVSTRLNDYYDNTDRFEVSGDLYRTRLGRSPFYFQSENSVAHLERTYSATNTADRAYDSARLDSANTLALPGRIGFLGLVPRATYRATYYSKSDPANGGGEELRQIPGAGLEASFHAAKTLSDRERWYGKGLRHKIEPYADYAYEASSVPADRLLQFDGTDRLGDRHALKMGLRNVLQTRREGRLSRFVDLDLYTHYRVEKHGAAENFDDLRIDARMPLTSRWMVDVEGRYDWYAGKIPFFNTRLGYDRGDIACSIEHLSIESGPSLWTPRINLFPEGRRSLEAYARYDDRGNDLEEIAAVGYLNRCCMRYGLGVHLYDGNEFGLMFSVGLSAFPKARLSSSF